MAREAIYVFSVHTVQLSSNLEMSKGRTVSLLVISKGLQIFIG